MGLQTIDILGGVPEEAEIIFYNSFARTYEGHGSDRAVIAGLLGFATDDIRIKTSFDEAKKAGLKYTFRSVGNASTFHPNSMRFKLKKGEESVEVLGISRGGGLIEIEEVNGYNAGFTTGLFTILVFAEDRRGSIAFISNILANNECNIATMNVSRKGKQGLACLVIEIDSEIRPLSLEYLRSLQWVKKVIYMLPVE